MRFSMTKIIIKYTQENTVAKLIANEPQIIQRKAEMTAILKFNMAAIQ